MIVMERLMTPEEVAEALQMHVETVKRLLRQGKLPGFKVAGQWRISPSELKTFLEEQRKKETKEN